MSDDARMAPVYLLGFVLIGVLLVANVVIAADRTALDSEHTIETFGKENVYSDLTAIVQDDTVERVNETIEAEKQQRQEEQLGSRELSDRERELLEQQISENLPNRTQQRQFVESAITTGFVEGELTRNLETIYAVLHGEQSDGRITVRIDGQKDQLNQSIRETLGDDPRINEEEIVATVSGEIPDEENLTEGGEIPSEVKGASAGVGLVGTLSWLLPLLSVGVLAGMFHFTGRDPRQTARSGGIAFLITGVLGALIGAGFSAAASGAAESALDADSPEVSAMSDGVVAVVDNLFGAILMQGLLLAGIGVVAIGAVVAEQRGYFDSLLNDDQPPRQGQYQQQHGQQGQYDQQGQYQQNQQGQYDQQGQYRDGQQYDQRQQYNQQGHHQADQYQNDQQGQHKQDQYDQQGQTSESEETQDTETNGESTDNGEKS